MELFIGIDMDNNALKMAKDKLKYLERENLSTYLIHGNFWY